MRREYSIGLRCEVKRKASGDDPKRAAELAAYFTHAKLQPGHVVLSLRSAMTQFYKLENFATAAIFARRLLEMNAPAKARARAQAPATHRCPYHRRALCPVHACSVARLPQLSSWSPAPQCPHSFFSLPGTCEHAARAGQNVSKLLRGGLGSSVRLQPQEAEL
jgi:hypothetical protein